MNLTLLEIYVALFPAFETLQVCSGGIHFVAHIEAIVSPRLHHQLLWSRVINTRGGAGNNIPSDLHMEHSIRLLKDTLAGVGANITEEVIVNASISMDGVQQICSSDTDLHPVSLHHTKKSSKLDQSLIVNQLVNESNVFDYIPGRKHGSFPNIKPNITQDLNTDKLFK